MFHKVNFYHMTDSSWFEGDGKKTSTSEINKQPEQASQNSHGLSNGVVYNGEHLMSTEKNDDIDDFFDS